ncbi:hypothetical protein N7532_004253 [Penicillium argentinense]|uniref:RRM domain-containing protein n=1 Tax=Penicillium argentinense TaxID=1131581 RepID=A0A9W9KER2_9EURO|nr:uncharacterized protein N7532_004253 [Penicillium argentinense]KAJ5103724.1 hypothetical protein N7532_004253 [Penicillium argentinense]
MKPFQIRDLHASSFQGGEESLAQPTRSHGVVRISAVDYDDLASTHPRARLTYPDDDDGDKIEVGSSFELSQRLDEPIDQNEPSPMHIFDIRRSNSVTELWKRFEDKADVASKSTDVKRDICAAHGYAPGTSTQDRSSRSSNSASSFSPGEASDPLLSGFEAELANLSLGPGAHETENKQLKPSFDTVPSASGPSDHESQPLMAAFEAELANLMNSTDVSGSKPPQIESSPKPESSARTSSQRTPHPIELLAAPVINHLVSGANMVHSEFTARLPELQRQLQEIQGQLQDAQRALPEHVGNSIVDFLRMAEVQLKTILDTYYANAGRPMAENAADGFRTVASEFNGLRQSLSAVLSDNKPSESTSDSAQANAASDVRSAADGAFSSTGTHATGPPDSSAQNPELRHMDSNKEVLAGQAPSAIPDPSRDATLLGTKNTRADTQTNPHFPYPHRRHRGSQPRVGSHPATPPVLQNHWQSPPSVPFWPSLNHLPWNLPPTRFPHHPLVPPPHPPPPPPPPPPFTGRWFNPDSFGNFLATPSDPYHEDGPSSSYRAQTSSNATQLLSEGGESTLFIGNVGFRVTERMIQDVFASKGFIVNAHLPLDTVSGKHAGFGYLHFPSKYPAMAAIHALQGAHIDGHAINLEFSENTPIESVRAPTNMSSNRDLPNRGQDDSKKPNSDARQLQDDSIKRRKSVTFKDPTPPAKETSTGDFSARAESPLIDLEQFEDTSPGGISLNQIEANLGHAVTCEDDSFAKFNPEEEMSRFPPVSQLEAHLATQNQCATPSSSVPASNSGQISEDLPKMLYNKSRTRGSRGLDDAPKTPAMVDTSGRNSGSSVLRRSSTMMIPRSELSSPVDNLSATGLRRRASERVPLRSSAGQDTWARLDRRERRLSRPSFGHNDLGGFTTWGISQPPAPASLEAEPKSHNKPEIANCISSLVDMGYGAAEEGGPSRIAVYAAASNGSLLDAIEMIEEERKAYARHDRK